LLAWFFFHRVETRRCRRRRGWTRWCSRKAAPSKVQRRGGVDVLAVASELDEDRVCPDALLPLHIEARRGDLDLKLEGGPTRRAGQTRQRHPQPADTTCHGAGSIELACMQGGLTWRGERRREERASARHWRSHKKGRLERASKTLAVEEGSESWSSTRGTRAGHNGGSGGAA